MSGKAKVGQFKNLSSKKAQNNSLDENILGSLERNRNEVYLPMKANKGKRLNRNNKLGMGMTLPREGSAVMSSLNHSSSDGMEGEEAETKPPREALSSRQPPA